MKSHFDPTWRTQNRKKRRFYSKYMLWLERIGYAVVIVVIVSFVAAFNYKVDDLVSADKVAIEAFSEPETSPEPVILIKALQPNFGSVDVGQPVFSLVKGERAIAHYTNWKQAADLQTRMGPTPEVAKLMSSLGEPRLTTIYAKAKGTFRFNEEQLGAVLSAGTELFRIVDYNDLRMSASLTGLTVSQAKLGQSAKVSAITIESGGGAVFRGDSRTGPLISGQLLDAKVKEALQKELSGYAVLLRDDFPLQINSVDELQVDAHVRQSGSGETGAKSAALDPPATYSLQARVLEGRPVAKVQLADLPPEVAQRIKAMIQSEVGGSVVQKLDGTTTAIESIDNVRLVAKISADQAAVSSTQVLPATQLARSYEAKLKLDQPPTFLCRAVENADRTGKTVTAKVELKTSTRPIALILLRKS